MSFQSNAHKHSPRSWFRWWYILLFTGLLLGVLLIFFPQQLLIDALTKNSQSSQLTVTYLRNLAALSSKNTDLQIALAKQEITLGNFANADKVVKPLLTWTPQEPVQWQAILIHLLVLTSQTFAYPEKSEKRLQGEKQMKQLLTVLTKYPDLSADQAKDLAQKALELNEAGLSVTFYKRAAESAPQSPDFLANAGKVALFVSDYQTSAQFYILAMKASKDLNQQRTYYQAALNSLLANGKTTTIMPFAEKNLGDLAKDQQTLIFLAKTAQSVGQKDDALKYIKQALDFQYNPPVGKK